MKKKGFTLVELLAVIVILAIIALIATPMILNVIDNAKKGASKSSALGYIEGIEKYIVLNEVTKEKDFSFEKGLGYEVESIKDYIEIKGDKPTEGWVCIGDKKEVEKAKLKINNYVIKYEDNKATVVDEEVGEMDCSAGEVNMPLTYQSYTTGTNDQVSTIYYNPEQATFCTETEYNNNSDKLGKTGCLKWYAIENSDSSKSTVNVILDHNTTATVAWNLTASSSEMKDVKDALVNDITTWNSDIQTTARLIETNEIAKITGNTTFDVSTSTDSEWFYFDTLSQEKTDIKNYSWLHSEFYWTSNKVAGTTGGTWGISYSGALVSFGTSDPTHCGVRPVITISKSVIS